MIWFHWLIIWFILKVREVYIRFTLFTSQWLDVDSGTICCSTASVCITWQGITRKQKHHGGLREPREFSQRHDSARRLPYRSIQMFSERIMSQSVCCGSGVCDICRGVWTVDRRWQRVLRWEECGADLHQSHFSEEDDLQPDGTEAAPAGHVILRRHPEGVVWGDGSNVTACEWPDFPQTE